MSVIETVLSPITWLMEFILGIYLGVCSSMGLSILFLSFTFALLLLPLWKMGQRLEDRIGRKMRVVDTEVQPLKGKLAGEELFLATEKIYEKHSYHPIHSVAMGASFLVMLPVLVSAILVFSADGILVGHGFLAIKDLSQPDGLLGGLNLLPIIMFAITFIDAKLRFSDDPSSRRRFMVISVVLLVLVYSLPAGLVLYWTGSNIMSFVLARVGARKSGPTTQPGPPD